MSAKIPENTSASNNADERKQGKEDSSKAKLIETKCSEIAIDNAASLHDRKEKSQAAKINGDVTMEQLASKKSKEDNGSDETATIAETTERDGHVERSSPKERNGIPKSNTQANINDSPADDSKSEDLGKSGEQIQGKKSEVQKNKAET